MTYDFGTWNGLIDIVMYLGLALMIIGAICLIISLIRWLSGRNNPANRDLTGTRGNPLPPGQDNMPRRQ